eukprot:gene8352-9206_t
MVGMHQRVESFHIITSQKITDIRKRQRLQAKYADQVMYLKKKQFWWFALIASLNHALNYVCTSYSTSLLPHQLGGIILGLNWILNAVSGLTVATPIVRGMGFKYSMILSLWGYAVQIATLYWAVITEDAVTCWVVAIIGSTVAGFTSAVWWTAQGVYFESVCQSINELYLAGHERSEKTAWRVEGDGHDGEEEKEGTAAQDDENGIINTVRADLSAHWTVIYQMADIVVFLSLSIFPIALQCSVHVVLLGQVVLGVITAVLGYTFESLSSDGSVSMQELYEAAVAVPKQYANDARVSLLAPFVFGFGITTAMFAYFVNSDLVSDSSGLGEVTLGFLEAFSYLIAVLSAFPYAYISNRYIRGQDWVIQFGSLSFMLSGLIVLVLPVSDLGTWPVMLIIKGLYGLGRGVFEGSCRAVYASMFTGSDLSTAFSGQTLSAGFSGGICFFLFGVLSRQGIASITIGNGVLALLTYFILMFCVDPKKVVSWSDLFAVVGGLFEVNVCCRSSRSNYSPIINSNDDKYSIDM